MFVVDPACGCVVAPVKNDALTSVAVLTSHFTQNHRSQRSVGEIAIFRKLAVPCKKIPA